MHALLVRQVLSRFPVRTVPSRYFGRALRTVKMDSNPDISSSGEPAAKKRRLHRVGGSDNESEDGSAPTSAREVVAQASTSAAAVAAPAPAPTAAPKAIHPFFMAKPKTTTSGGASSSPAALAGVKRSHAEATASGSAASTAAPTESTGGSGGSAGGSAAADDAPYERRVDGYDPVADAPWKGGAGRPVPYAALVSVFGTIEATTKRLAITEALCNYFRSVIALCPEDLLPSIYLCTSTLAPAYENLELGVGDSLIIKAISEATGRATKDVKAEINAEGDVGLVAESSRSKQRTLFGAGSNTTLTVRGVFATLKGIAHESGKSSQDKKVATIKKLLVGCQGPEARYIVRSMQGKLRISLAKATVLVALAHAITLTAPVAPGTELSRKANALLFQATGRGDLPPVLLDTSKQAELETRTESAVTVLKQVYSELPSYDAIVPALLRGGVEGARAACQLVPGVPVTPMLAKPTKGIREVLTRFENIEFTCEWKYDGERAQVHITEDGRIRIFSRNSEDTTSKYPDLGIALQQATGRLAIEEGGSAAAASSSAASSSGGAGGGAGAAAAAAPAPRVTTCVLDGEAVAFDRERNCLLPFQVLSTRARKDVALDSIKVQVIYVAFDLLYLNGESLLHTPLAKRRTLLREVFREVPGRFAFATHAESNDTEEIGAFLSDAVKGGCEGLMVKVLNGPESVYEPSKRSLNWLKLKKDYMDGLTDSFDLVPVAAWNGRGKRTGVYGAYLLACYDPENDEYQSVCKVGTGFSDEMLASLTAVFKEKGCIRDTKPRNVVVGDSLSDADVWFSPEDSEVWEVMAADLSISPVHMGALGKVDEDKGIGLRFPRFLRRRDDKGTADATNADQVAQMYRDQGSLNPTAAGGDDDEED